MAKGNERTNEHAFQYSANRQLTAPKTAGLFNEMRDLALSSEKKFWRVGLGV